MHYVAWLEAHSEAGVLVDVADTVDVTRDHDFNWASVLARDT